MWGYLWGSFAAVGRGSPEWRQSVEDVGPDLRRWRV